MPGPDKAQSHLRTIALRAVFIAAALAAWYATQSWIGSRSLPAGACSVDVVHNLTAPINAWLTVHPATTNGLLMATSGIIDALGFFLLGSGLFGPSARPAVELIVLFALRQLAQAFVALPPPVGMLWRDPGCPSAFVTYGVSNDFFFSGHTAIAVLGAIELARLGRKPWAILGATLALVEIATVLVLRAHYTMDVITGAAMAGLVAAVAPYFERSRIAAR